ncbi:MAG: hypothetical protein Q9166_005362 [cf. Caloplaca sp. 2 TL-2023]
MNSPDDFLVMSLRASQSTFIIAIITKTLEHAFLSPSFFLDQSSDIPSPSIRFTSSKVYKYTSSSIWPTISSSPKEVTPDATTSDSDRKEIANENHVIVFNFADASKAYKSAYGWLAVSSSTNPGVVEPYRRNEPEDDPLFSLAQELLCGSKISERSQEPNIYERLARTLYEWNEGGIGFGQMMEEMKGIFEDLGMPFELWEVGHQKLWDGRRFETISGKQIGMMADTGP